MSLTYYLFPHIATSSADDLAGNNLRAGQKGVDLPWTALYKRLRSTKRRPAHDKWHDWAVIWRQ